MFSQLGVTLRHLWMPQKNDVSYSWLKLQSSLSPLPPSLSLSLCLSQYFLLMHMPRASFAFPERRILGNVVLFLHHPESQGPLGTTGASVKTATTFSIFNDVFWEVALAETWRHVLSMLLSLSAELGEVSVCKFKWRTLHLSSEKSGAPNGQGYWLTFVRGNLRHLALSHSLSLLSLKIS